MSLLFALRALPDALVCAADDLPPPPGHRSEPQGVFNGLSCLESEKKCTKHVKYEIKIFFAV